ncbi:MAG: aspartate dehydrogenase [Acidilobaceae archaeon]
MRVAIIGCGAIGSTLAKYIANGTVKADLVAVMDIVPEKCEKLTAVSRGVEVCSELECLLEKNPDIVVEAASQEAVRRYVPRIVEKGVSVIVLSVGALLDEKLYSEIEELARMKNVKIYMPTGAIAGIDAVKALALEKVHRVVLRTSKSHEALGIEKGEDKLLYRGPASEAVRLYPANVNVAATLTLAAGMEATVEIWARRGLEVNVHEIEIESEASRVYVRVENKPHPSNPKTSYLAVLSAVRLLKQICEGGIIIGT